MRKRDLHEVIRENLHFFMGRSVNCRNANALHVVSKGKISANTVRNLLDSNRRTTTVKKPLGYPTLDKLAVVAEALGREVWELLHPDIERSIKERDIYRIFEETAKKDIVEELAIKRPARQPGRLEERKG